MVDDKQNKKIDQQHSNPQLLEIDLHDVVAGTKASKHTHKVITGSHSCQWFQAKDSIELAKDSSKFCSYCRYKTWLGVDMVCNHPYNK